MAFYWLRFRGTRFPVRRGSSTIGRSPYCTVVLSNRLASREHATLDLGPDSLVIEDLGSANGTRVNGEFINGRRGLADRDTITIGSDVLEVEVGEPPEGRSAKTVPDAPTADLDCETQTSASAIDLVDALAIGLLDASDPKNVAQSVRAAIDAVLEKAARVGSPEANARLLGAVDRVAAHFPDAAWAEWRRGAHERLRKG